MSYYIRDRSHDFFVTNRSTQFHDDLGEMTEKISSAKRILAAADDAAGLAAADRLKVRADGLARAHRNLQDGVSVAQIAEGGFELLTDLLQKIRVYAVQCGNDTYDDGQRDLAQLEVDQLLEEIDRQVETIRFNGKSILDGSYGDGGTPLVLQIGSGEGETVSISIRSLSTSSLGVDVLAGNGVSTRAAAESALAVLSDAISTVVETRAKIGAVSQRIDRVLAFLGITGEDQRYAESGMRDLDMAEGGSALQRVRTLEQASLYSLKRSGALADGVLGLL